MIKWIFSTLVLIGVVLALTKYVDSDVLEAVARQADWHYLWLAAGATLAMKLLETVQFKIMASRSADMSMGQAIRLYIGGQPPTILPGGIFFRAAMLNREFGTQSWAASTIVLMHSAVYILILIFGSIAGALSLERQQPWIIGVAAVAFLMAALLYVRSTRQVLLSWLSKVAAARNLQDKVHQIRESLSFLLSPAVAVMALLFSVMILVADVSVLYFAQLAFEVRAGMLALVLALTFPSLLGRLSALPLGIGVLDASMVGVISLHPNVGVETAVLIVGAYRLVRFVLPITVGVVVYFLLWLPKHGTPLDS